MSTDQIVLKLELHSLELYLYFLDRQCFVNEILFLTYEILAHPRLSFVFQYVFDTEYVIAILIVD